MNLRQRVSELEQKGGSGLALVCISWLPSRLPGRHESATYAGVTYTQEAAETSEQFRARLAESLKSSGKRFIWVSELDAAL